jgi:hypothetical protein
MEPDLRDSTSLSPQDSAAWRFIAVASYLASLMQLLCSILLHAFAYGIKTIASVEFALSMLFESMEVTE